MSGLTYRNEADERADKLQQDRLLTALNAWDRALRRDECAAWVINGKYGSIITWGDKARAAWALYVQRASKTGWTVLKRRFAFMRVTQDGDMEGVFKLERLPTPEEAELIRDVLGIRKRVEYSPEELERRRAWSLAVGAINRSDGERENEGSSASGPLDGSECHPGPGSVAEERELEWTT